MYITSNEEDDGDTTVLVCFSDMQKDELLSENKDAIFLNCKSNNSYIVDIDVFTLGCNITTTYGSISFNMYVCEDEDEDDKYPLEVLETKTNIDL